MEEKILIEGKFYKRNILAIISAATSFITLVCTLLYTLYSFRITLKMQSFRLTLRSAFQLGYFKPIFVVGIPLLILSAIFYFWMSGHRLTVTDKRISGRTRFGIRVDLPVDSISAVGTGIFDAISVATSSGRISFIFLKNREEILKVLGDLVIDRQGNGSARKGVRQQNGAEELKTYKELLDSGVISQEEFEAKKRQLLGL